MPSTTMAACLPITVTRASSRKKFLSDDQLTDNNGDRGPEESRGEEGLASLSMSKKLVRSVSLKLRKLNWKFEEEGEEGGRGPASPAMPMEEQGKQERWPSGKCLGLYGKGGRCRVGDEISQDFVGRNRGPRKAVDDTCVAFVRGNADTESDYRREFHGCLALDAGFERLREWNRRDSKVENVSKSMDKKKVTNIDVTDRSLKILVDGEGEGLGSEKRQGGRLDCFACSRTDKLWRRNSYKSAERSNNITSSTEERHLSLPDDIIEMCLARASFISLINARLVCKKWKTLTTSTHFMQMRASYLPQKPWLFLFGLSRDGVCVGQIQALDTTLDKWHRIDADILRGRFMFSVASTGSSIYVIGGCSSSINSGRINKPSYKTHKAVLVYSPLIGSWKKIAPMKTARALPVVGVFEICCGSNIHSGCYKGKESSNYEKDGHEGERDNRSKLSTFEGRHVGVSSCSTSRCSQSRRKQCSEVYDGFQKPSSRPHLWEVLQETKMSDSQGALPCSLAPDLRPDLGKIACGEFEEDRDQYRLKETKAFGLIVAGGQGLRNEHLDSAEIYDPISNKWIEIARLPADYGIVCAGVVCKGIFYVYSKSDKLAAYDFEQGSWIEIQIANPPVRLPDYLPKLVSCRGHLFMLSVSWGGIEDLENGRDKATRKLWELDLSSYSWTEISWHPDAPLDWNASFVGNGDQIYGVEMFKIFGQVLDFVTVCDVSGQNVKWSRIPRISREHVAQDMDASSCMTKAAVVVQL